MRAAPEDICGRRDDEYQGNGSGDTGQAEQAAEEHRVDRGYGDSLGAGRANTEIPCREQHAWRIEAKKDLGPEGLPVAGQVTAQLAPLRVNAAGAASLEFQVPWEPRDAVPPGGMAPLWLALVIVTFSPDWVNEPSFQALVMCWSPGKVNPSVHPLTAEVPVLVIVTWATNPP